MSTFWGTDQCSGTGIRSRSLSLALSLRSSLAKRPDPASRCFATLTHRSGFLIPDAKCAGTSLPLRSFKKSSLHWIFFIRSGTRIRTQIARTRTWSPTIRRSPKYQNIKPKNNIKKNLPLLIFPKKLSSLLPKHQFEHGLN